MVRRFQSEKRNLLVLDAGNLFFRISPKDRSEKEELTKNAKIMIQAYNVMGYDGMNVGERDLILGHGFLTQLGREADFPFISSNLRGKGGMDPALASHMIKNVSSFRIGVFGLIDPGMLGERSSEFVVSDPLDEAQRAVEELKGQCDFVIALSQLGEAKDVKLALSVPDINLIIGGMKSKTTKYSKIRDTLLVRVVPRGGYLGVLDLILRDTQPPFRFADLSDRDELLRKVERIAFQARLIEDRIDEMPSKQRKVKLRELDTLRRREQELRAEAASYATGNTFHNQTIPISIRIDDDPAVIKLIEAYRR